MEMIVQDNRIDKIATRLFRNEYQQLMLVILSGTITFILFQLWAARIEFEFRSRHGICPAYAPIIAALSGRSPSFWDRKKVSYYGDEGLSELNYNASASKLPISTVLWLFPMLGFLGTVYGLSGAVADLSTISNTTGGLTAEKIAPVFRNLDVAFDTTIQGIISAIIVSVFAISLDMNLTRIKAARPKKFLQETACEDEI
ncbi:MotA/TolQ/ExbB proton channel family protein [Lentilitoribacter sp. EG35]|uniref:MotA/TolQ/ExbB proton channel family protein n=1 Tax=Lentilitoribacter sp. EG35 TaxID=3234192 RepID=UPI00345FD981